MSRARLPVRTKLAWSASLLLAAVLGAGLAGQGTYAVWSDSVAVTHTITTGHLKLKIVAVDGQALDVPADEYALADDVRGSQVDLTRVVEIRNDGTLPVAVLTLTTTPSPDDVAVLAEELTLEVRVTDESGEAVSAATLASWESSGPADLGLPTTMEPGESVLVTLHVTGTLTGHEKDSGVQPVYTFTGLES